MVEPLPDTWNSRDLPVLREIARAIDIDVNHQGVRFEDLPGLTGLDFDQVYMACRALESEGLITVRLLMPVRKGRVTAINGRARKLVGLWPSEETALDRILTALEAIATNTNDEDTRTRARKILDALSGAGQTIGISVATAAITGQIPGAN